MRNADRNIATHAGIVPANARLRAVRAVGFSLVEMLVVIAIVGILLSLALPSFREFLVRSQVRQLNNELIIDLNFARAEAIRRGSEVALLPNDAGWSGGWRVVVDSTGRHTFTEAGDVALRAHSALPGGYDLKASAGLHGAGVALTAYSSLGTLALPATTSYFAICRPDNDSALSQLVTVATSGTISSHRNVGTTPFGSGSGC